MQTKISDDQNIANEWSHAQVRKFKWKSKLFYKKTKILTKALINRNWKNDYKNVEKSIYANKALIYGASRNIPYSTLELLGKSLSHDQYADSVKEIIKNNVIVIDGLVYKLDDPNQQIQIRKALKMNNYKNVRNYAA